MKSELSHYSKNYLFSFLRIATFTVLVGRVYQHLFFDIPLSALFWNQDWMEPWVRLIFNMDWETFARSNVSEALLIYPKLIFGCIYLCTAIFSLFKKPTKQKGDFLLLLSSLLLAFLALLEYLDHFRYSGQFIEHSLQIGSPLFLYWWSRKTFSKARFILMVKVAVSLTFIGHGLYAFGFYPIPVKFIEMTFSLLPFDESGSRIFLRIAGALDFLIAVGIYFPKIARPLLAYAAIWGLFTALARIMAYFNPELLGSSLHQWWYMTLLRMPHMLIPLMLFIFENQKRSSTAQSGKA